MAHDKRWQDLLDYAGNGPVLSVYLNTDPQTNRAEQVKLTLKNLLKKADLPKDAAAVQHFVEMEWDWRGRGLAVFSAQSEGFFKALPLELPVRNRLFVAPRPYIKPLVNLEDNYGHYGLALVDKQRARFFAFHLGALSFLGEVTGEAVRQARGDNDLNAAVREQVQRNLKAAVEAANRYFTVQHVRKVVLGGTDDNVPEFRDLLPKRWQSLIVGQVNLPLDAPETEIRERLLNLAEEAERKQEARLIERLLTEAAKGRAAALGLDETISLVTEGRVQQLVVREGYEAGGWRCEQCGYLTVQTLDACPFCGSGFEPIADAVEMAIRKALQDGAEVEVVAHNGSLQETGIGAFLRY